MSDLAVHWGRVRRRWRLILLVGVLCAALAAGLAALGGSTYTARSALTNVSQNPDRAPERDTVLSLGYVNYFNQPSTQVMLRRAAGIGPEVRVTARVAARSPILYIEATAGSAELADRAATGMARALRDAVNSGLGTGEQLEARLERELDVAQAAGDDRRASQLRTELRTLDQTAGSQLRDLQIDAGVARNPSTVAQSASAGLVGGLMFGVLFALALGRFENRLVTPGEVSERLRLPVLSVVASSRRRSEAERRHDLMRALVGVTDTHGMPRPGTLAVTGPTEARRSTARIAVALAGLRAQQGQTTLLLLADPECGVVPDELAGAQGVTDFLAEGTPHDGASGSGGHADGRSSTRSGGARIEGKVVDDGRGLIVGPPGTRTGEELALFSKSHVSDLLDRGSLLADLVVVAAPPIDVVEGRVVAGAADRTLLVLEEGRTRARDAATALDGMGNAGATALGVILVRDPAALPDPGHLHRGAWTQARTPSDHTQPIALPKPAAGTTGDPESPLTLGGRR